MNHRTDTHIAAWLALLLFGIYWLSFSGQLYSQDSMSMFAVTESFVKRGEFNTDQLWTLFKARNEIAPNGESYAKYGYGTSLFAVPLYALALILPGNLGLAQTTLLTSSIVIALSGALVFLSARRLKFSRGVSTSTALLFGLATPAWVYAKQLWSEPYALFALFAAFYFLQRFRDESRGSDALIAGIALGLAVAVRVTNAALVPLYAWYGFAWTSIRSGTQRRGVPSKEAWRGLMGFTLALGFIALTIGYYNWARYGNPISTGYRPDETFDNPLLLGLYGLLFSPGKGLFVYVPFLAALPFSFVLFIRRAKREAFLIGAVFTFYVLLFSLWYYWWGGTNWGPRFLVPLLPFSVLLIAPAIALPLSKTGAGHGGGGLFRLLFSALVVLSIAIQLIGVAVPSLAYRARMFKISPNPDVDAIFQPFLSPIIGSLNLIRPTVLDFAWIRIVDGETQIDGWVIGLTIGFIALCVLSLRGMLTADRRPLTAILLAIALASALSLFTLYRFRDDVRFGGSAGYRALLQTIAREEQARDVMILNDDTRAPFFLNENRARLRWYGLSRDPKQFDAVTRALLTRLSQQYARVWFVFDDAAPHLPDATRDWLDEALHRIDERDFDDGVHLIMFAAPAQR